MGVMKNSISDKEIELFERFSSKLMSAKESQEFENVLKSDPILKDKYLFYTILIEKVKDEAKISETLKARFKKANARSKRFNLKRFLWGSAAAVLITLCLIAIKLNHKQTDKNYLFEEPGIVVKMDAANDLKWNSFNTDYANKNYKNCLVDLRANLINDTAIYYSGICFEGLNNYDSAIVYYSKLVNSPNIVLRQKGNFRMGILLLNYGNKDQGIALLKSIASDSFNEYRNSAKEVIAKINE